jgi:hypothetical protein
VKRVLFHSYHFPPIGGASVQRAVARARCLPGLGYEPVVVTGPGETTNRWAPADETFLADLPSGMEVHRVAGPEPDPLTGWSERAQRWLRLREPWSRWWVEGSLEISRTLVDDVDVIYVWMHPYDSAEAAATLARESGKPWVADLGDPWALDEMMIYPTGAHRGRELARMRALLGTAAAIVMSTPEAAARLQAHSPEFERKPVVSIPNGFDPRHFEGARPVRSDGAFRIVHTGYLHTHLGLRARHQTSFARRRLGGAVPGVDILTRSHVFLLEAIEELKREKPALAAPIELHLAGVLSATDREVARGSNVVRAVGYLPHDETVALMRAADLLFLPMHDLPPGTRATIVPGKTYEYLAALRPILAAVPDGDARDLLSEAGGALLCRPPDVGAIKEILVGQLHRFVNGEPGPVPDPAVIARYEYPRLAERLAHVLDGVTPSLRAGGREEPVRGAA